MNFRQVTGTLKIIHDLPNDLPFAKAQNALYVFSDEEFRLFFLDGIIKEPVQLIALVLNGASPVGK